MKFKDYKPQVGMFCTQCFVNDMYPYEVISVKDENHCVVRACDYEYNELYEGGYKITSNPEGDTYHLVKRKGVWRNYEWDTDYHTKIVLDDGRIVNPQILTRRLGSCRWKMGKGTFYRCREI